MFQEALSQERLYGLADGVLFRREHLIVVRPIEGMLIFTFLTYPEGVKSPSFFASRLPRMKNTSRELEMAKALIGQLVDPKFDIHKYRDSYAENLMKLIQAKAKGQRIEAPQEEQEPVGLDFMEALKRSLRKQQKRHRSGAGRLPGLINGEPPKKSCRMCLTIPQLATPVSHLEEMRTDVLSRAQH